MKDFSLIGGVPFFTHSRVLGCEKNKKDVFFKLLKGYVWGGKKEKYRFFSLSIFKLLNLIWIDKFFN